MVKVMPDLSLCPFPKLCQSVILAVKKQRSMAMHTHLQVLWRTWNIHLDYAYFALSVRIEYLCICRIGFCARTRNHHCRPLEVARPHHGNPQESHKQNRSKAQHVPKTIKTKSQSEPIMVPKFLKSDLREGQTDARVGPVPFRSCAKVF